MPTISSELFSVDTLQILPAEDAFVQGHFLMPEENGQLQTYSEIPGQEYGDQWNASRVNWWITALAILLVILYLRRFTSILPHISRGVLRWREIISMEGNMRLCRERDSVAAAALLISFVCVSRLDLLPAEFLAALTPGWKTLASAGVIVGYNPRTLAAIAVYLSAQANLDNSTKYLNGLLKIAKIKKRCKEPSDKLFALLDYGLAREDEDTYQAYENLYCLYKGPFEKIDKYILEKMSEQGNGKATFTLGNLSLTSASDKKSLVIWKKAAEQGNGFSKLNLAMGHLIKKEIPKAIYYATQSIRHGIVFGYYILYKAYLEDNPALAFTYLRYAKEYLIPDAVSEYKAAVNSGVYEPLPYMKRIEELEKMAENNAPACLVMSEIYNSAILLPYNIERTFHYQQLAISNGCVSFFSFYKEIYGHAFPPDMEKSSVFSSFRKSLEKMQSFFSGAATDDSAEHEAVVNKVEEIYEALVKGTTELENDVLYELSESKFYNHFGHKVKLPKSLRKPIECSVDELKEKLQDGTYNTLLGSDFYQHPGQNVIAYCLEEPYSKLPNSQNLLITRALMSVRALTFAPEYSTYKEFMKLAKNSGNTTAMILGDLDFSAVCDSKEGALDINKCERTGEENAELSDPDVFISTVAQ